MATGSANNAPREESSSQPGIKEPLSSTATLPPVAVPLQTISKRPACVCPDCKGTGYDRNAIFWHGGNTRPCSGCLLVGFVYLDTGDPLSDDDAITIMRQVITRMRQRVKILRERKPACQCQQEQHFGINKNGYRGD